MDIISENSEEFDNRIKVIVSSLAKEGKLSLNSDTEHMPESNKSEAISDAAKFIGSFELHRQAILFIKLETEIYQNRFLELAKMVAENEGEKHVITKSHAELAKELIRTRRKKYEWSDLNLGLGGLLLGPAITNLIEIYSSGDKTKADVLMLTLGFIGSILFTIGVIQKAKG